MDSLEFRKRLTQTRHAVVKLGTQLLTGQDGRLDLAYFRQFAGQVKALRDRGMRVTVVSSGAVGAGMAHLGMNERPDDVATLQAIAAVGQPQLMRHMREAFEPFDLKVAQLLLTRSDFEDRLRFLNIRNCIAVLQEKGCIPIINENDTVAVEEIRFGDNDTLAALISNALRADALVLLTVVEGLLDGEGKVIDLVDDVRAASKHIKTSKSKLGTGGMVTKHTAASIVTEAGEIAVIAGGRQPDVLLRIFNGESVGTLFSPADRQLDSRQRWIGLTKRPAGTLTVDDGAAQALRQRGKSLLASGIISVNGSFEEGDVVLVQDTQGQAVARGLSNYNCQDLKLIQGKKTGEFHLLLGRQAFAEVIHRDNLVLLSL